MCASTQESAVAVPLLPRLAWTVIVSGWNGCEVGRSVMGVGDAAVGTTRRMCGAAGPFSGVGDEVVVTRELMSAMAPSCF